MALSVIIPALDLIRRQVEGEVNVTAPPDARPDISETDFWTERTYMAGVVIGATAYGVHATIFFITLSLLWKRKRSSWKDWIWIIYIFVVFGTSSVGNAVQAKFMQMIWIDNRDYGPSRYWIDGSAEKIVVSGNVIYIACLWLQDGLLLYRFWIIFGKRTILTIVPFIIFLTSFGISLCVMIMLTQPGMTMWGPIVFQLFTSYWSISVGFNVLLTGLIVGRLLHMRNKIGHAMAGPYASISAMLIESASLYTVLAIAFIVTFALNSTLQNLILPTLAQVQSIAPMLIIMRVAQGQAWTAETNARLMQSTNMGFHTSSSGGGARSGRTGQTDTYAMSTPSFSKSGGVSTRVETVTWQDDGSRDDKVHHVV